MWLDALKEIKAQKGMSCKQIAAVANLPERTVVRIFSGETPNPYIDTLHHITAALDTSLNEIFGDTKAVVGTQSLAVTQEDLDKTTAELERVRAELELIKAEYAVQASELVTLRAENDILRVKVELKDEIIATHKYYLNRG